MKKKLILEKIEKNKDKMKKLGVKKIGLFGSFVKGKQHKKSDVDILIETYSNKKVNLSNFEKKLGHKISLFSETKITKLPDELFNNVVNGIKLWGAFKIK